MKFLWPLIFVAGAVTVIAGGLVLAGFIFWNAGALLIACGSWCGI